MDKTKGPTNIGGAMIGLAGVIGTIITDGAFWAITLAIVGFGVIVYTNLSPRWRARHLPTLVRLLPPSPITTEDADGGAFADLENSEVKIKGLKASGYDTVFRAKSSKIDAEGVDASVEHQLPRSRGTQSSPSPRSDEEHS